MNELISLIVPVYNVADYISSSIESIMKQSYRNFELLLIDDGSTDASGLICDQFAQQDLRIKVVHKSNEGVSSARNTGLENAKGNWIAFMDADDLLPEDALQNMLTEAHRNRVDIVISAMQFIGNGQNNIIQNDYSVRKQPKSEAFIFESLKAFQMSCCGKLYRSDKLVGKKFNNEIPNYEDYLFLWDIVSESPSYVLIDKVGYIVRYRIGSASRTRSIQSLYNRIHSLVYACKKMQSLFSPYKRIKKYLSCVLLSESLCNRTFCQGLSDASDIYQPSLTLWKALLEVGEVSIPLRCLMPYRLKQLKKGKATFSSLLYYALRLALKIELIHINVVSKPCS